MVVILELYKSAKIHHVEDAADAVNIELSDDEIKTMEKLADKANVNTIRIWEKEMNFFFLLFLGIYITKF